MGFYVRAATSLPQKSQSVSPASLQLYTDQLTVRRESTSRPCEESSSGPNSLSPCQAALLIFDFYFSIQTHILSDIPVFFLLLFFILAISATNPSTKAIFPRSLSVCLGGYFLFALFLSMFNLLM